MVLRVGDKAPDFTLPSQTGEMVSLHDYLGRKNVILYFYPRDFTMGCTMEAHSFRDNYSAFVSTETEVIGISSDTVESHKKFSETCGLPFDLLSDSDSRVRNAYGVTSALSVLSSRMTRRTTFLDDKDGIVRAVISSELRPRKHVAEAIRALARTRQDGAQSP